jgi:hypothetical protein
MALALSKPKRKRDVRFAPRLVVEAMFNQGELETLVEQQLSHVQVLGIDAGGTLTDTFFVRSDGRFVVGKAQGNPADDSGVVPRRAGPVASRRRRGISRTGDMRLTRERRC